MEGTLVSLEEMFYDWSAEFWERGYHSPDAMVFHQIHGVDPPIVNVVLADDHKSVILELQERDDITMYSGSIKSGILELPRELVGLKNFIHDFTFGLWTRSTDVKLSQHFPTMPYDLGKLTPDYIFEDEKNVLIVEFATCNSADSHALLASYVLKSEKYDKAVRAAALTKPDKLVFLAFVIIGNGVAVSNLNLTNGVLSELSLRTKIARRVFTTLRDNGIVTPDIVKRDPDELKLYQFLLQTKVAGPNMTDEFSEENYHKLLEPEDHEVSKRLFEQCLGKAALRVKTESDARPSSKSEVLEQVDVQWDLYKSTVLSNNPEGFSYHPKSIVNVPASSPRYDPQPNFNITQAIQKLLLMGGSNGPVYNCWLTSMNDYQCKPHLEEPLEPEDPEGDEIQEEEVLHALNHLSITMDERYTEEGEKKTKAQRRSYNRVTASLGPSEWVELATVGINGKYYSSHPEVQAYRREKKKPMAMDIDVTDLSSFMKSDLSDWFDHTLNGDFFSPSLLKVLALINRADNLHPNRAYFNQYYGMLSDFVRTEFYKWSKFISDVATEVAISFKQHCSSKEFIIKKLRDWDCLILIKPSRSGSHCFFSLLTSGDKRFEKQTGNIFRSWNSDGHVSWTDFVSLNKSKISNWVQAESRALSCFVFWTEAMRCEPYVCCHRMIEDETAKSNGEPLFQEAYRMVWLSTLIGLCDKAEVEEACSLSRFIVMESFVNPPLVPFPEKMMEKFPERCRSRLTIWIINRLKELCYHCKTRPVRLIEEPMMTGEGLSSTDTREYLTWSGLKNWYTDRPTSDPGFVVNLMYIGYIKNKHEDSEVNAESKLLNKILTLEEKLTPEVMARIGRDNKPFNSGTFHECNNA